MTISYQRSTVGVAKGRKANESSIEKSWWPHLKPLTKRGGGPALNRNNLFPVTKKRLLHATASACAPNRAESVGAVF